MSHLILHQKFFPSGQTDSRQILLLCGFGGKIWQVSRLIATLHKAGYDVTAMDFTKDVLSKGDPTLLPQLITEVQERAETLAKDSPQPVLLVGVSLGSLISLNILRRSKLFHAGVLITGGDIAKIARKIYPKQWPQPYDNLADTWQDINMYSEPHQLTDKRLLFVLHESSKLIDVCDVRQEVARQQTAGNTLRLIERTHFDHVGTIIEETILFPKRILEYINYV